MRNPSAIIEIKNQGWAGAFAAASVLSYLENGDIEHARAYYKWLIYLHQQKDAIASKAYVDLGVILTPDEIRRLHGTESDD